MTPEELEAERQRAERILLDRVQAAARRGATEGVADAARLVFTPENVEIFWSGAVKVMRKKAVHESGTWLLDGIGKTAKAAMWGVVIFVGLWMTIGLEGMIAVVKAIAKARSGG